jgi:hypothetical protein
MTDYNLSWWLGVDVDVTPLSIGVYGHYITLETNMAT